MIVIAFPIKGSSLVYLLHVFTKPCFNFIFDSSTNINDIYNQAYTA